MHIETVPTNHCAIIALQNNMVHKFSFSSNRLISYFSAGWRDKGWLASVGLHKATAKFHSADITENIQNVVKFIPYSYQYVQQRCASIAAQYLDVTEIHVSNTFVNCKTVLLSDIKLHRVGEWLLATPRSTHPHDLTPYPIDLNPQLPCCKNLKFYTREI